MGQEWHEIVVEALKSNEVRLVAYVPDKVLSPLIRRIVADDWFTVISPGARRGGGRHRDRRLRWPACAASC